MEVQSLGTKVHKIFMECSLSKDESTGRDNSYSFTTHPLISSNPFSDGTFMSEFETLPQSIQEICSAQYSSMEEMDLVCMFFCFSSNHPDLPENVSKRREEVVELLGKKKLALPTPDEPWINILVPLFLYHFQKGEGLSEEEQKSLQEKKALNEDLFINEINKHHLAVVTKTVKENLFCAFTNDGKKAIPPSVSIVCLNIKIEYTPESGEKKCFAMSKDDLFHVANLEGFQRESIRQLEIGQTDFEKRLYAEVYQKQRTLQRSEEEAKVYATFYLQIIGFGESKEYAQFVAWSFTAIYESELLAGNSKAAAQKTIADLIKQSAMLKKPLVAGQSNVYTEAYISQIEAAASESDAHAYADSYEKEYRKQRNAGLSKRDARICAGVITSLYDKQKKGGKSDVEAQKFIEDFIKVYLEQKTNEQSETFARSYAELKAEGKSDECAQAYGKQRELRESEKQARSYAADFEKAFDEALNHRSLQSLIPPLVANSPYPFAEAKTYAQAYANQVAFRKQRNTQNWERGAEIYAQNYAKAYRDVTNKIEPSTDDQWVSEKHIYADAYARLIWTRKGDPDRNIRFSEAYGRAYIEAKREQRSHEYIIQYAAVYAKGIVEEIPDPEVHAREHAKRYLGEAGVFYRARVDAQNYGFQDLDADLFARIFVEQIEDKKSKVEAELYASVYTSHIQEKVSEAIARTGAEKAALKYKEQRNAGQSEWEAVAYVLEFNYIFASLKKAGIEDEIAHIYSAKFAYEKLAGKADPEAGETAELFMKGFVASREFNQKEKVIHSELNRRCAQLRHQMQAQIDKASRT